MQAIDLESLSVGLPDETLAGRGLGEGVTFTCNPFYMNANNTNGYYLLNQAVRDLAIMDIRSATPKLKSVNLYGAGKIGNVDVSGSTPTFSKQYYF